MYQQYFGLSGRAFATTPDLHFYFDSFSHRRALAYLRHGTLEGDSFMVMTGDIGAGKTTLIHKLLLDLDASAIAPALLVSSQLNTQDLLASVLRALGAPVSAGSVDELQASLETFLATLRSSGRRALVIVDEAQNLEPDAVQHLAVLAQLQSTGGALQLLLVGQPELRASLQRHLADTTHQPIFLFCHVGLLSRRETRSYIEHRLRQVGWTGFPSFEDDAYECIHRATGGVPRRVNRLCERLLTAVFVQQLQSISAELVEHADLELRDELGEGMMPPASDTEEEPPRPSADMTPPPAADMNFPRALPVLRAAIEDRLDPLPAGTPPTIDEPRHHGHRRPSAKHAVAAAAAIAGVALAWLIGAALRTEQAIPLAAVHDQGPAQQKTSSSGTGQDTPGAQRVERAADPGAQRGPSAGVTAVATASPAMPPPAPEVKPLPQAPPGPAPGACTPAVEALGLCPPPTNQQRKE